MPDPNLATAIREAYARAPSDVVILTTIALYHDDWDQPQYLVRDHVDLIATIEPSSLIDAGKAVLFSAAAFSFSMPEMIQTSVPQVKISVDNVSGALLPLLSKAVSSGKKITLVFRPYLSNDTSTPQMNPPLELVLSAVSVDAYRITATAQQSDIARRSFPNVDYTLQKFPALANF